MARRVTSGGVGIEIDVAGDVQLSRELLRFAGRITDASPAFEAIADDLREIETEQFDSQGGRSSGGWRALKASTVAAKSAAGLDSRILHATLAMRKSFTDKSDPAHVEKVTKDSLTFGSSDPKAGIHQQGSSDGAHPPQRRPLELTTMDREGIVKKLQRFMVEGTT